MKVAVVAWNAARGELKPEDLTESANWVLEQSKEEWAKSAFSVYEYEPKVFFTYPSYPNVFRAHGGNQRDVWMSTGQFTIVVTDEEITQAQADRIMLDYYEEGDERRAYYELCVALDDGRRADRSSAVGAAEQDPVLDRGDSGREDPEARSQEATTGGVAEAIWAQTEPTYPEEA